MGATGDNEYGIYATAYPCKKITVVTDVQCVDGNLVVTKDDDVWVLDFETPDEE